MKRNEVIEELKGLGINLPEPQDVYTPPNGYLEQLNNNLIEEVQILDVTDKFANKEVYAVPANYLENFKVQGASLNLKEPQKKNLTYLISKLGIAASVALLLTLGYLQLQTESAKPSTDLYSSVSTDELLNYQEENLLDVEIGQELDIQLKLQEANDEQILNYLEEEAIDVELNS
jgi:hypothetical protein